MGRDPVAPLKAITGTPDNRKGLTNKPMMAAVLTGLLQVPQSDDSNSSVP